MSEGCDKETQLKVITKVANLTACGETEQYTTRLKQETENTKSN